MEIKVSYPEMLPVFIDEKAIKQAVDLADGRYVLLIVPATKPCFYKLWSLMDRCMKKAYPFLILNAGQHYDDLLGHGLTEFGFNKHIAIDLKIRGDLAQKSSEIFLKIKLVAEYLKKNFPKTTFMPFVNGDTLTAAVLPAAWMFSFNEMPLHGEAGLRGMSPSFFGNIKKVSDIERFVEEQFTGDWMLMRNEPFPEQYDTFVGSAGCSYFFAPHKINKDNLLREGYPKNTISLTGNPVVDVVNLHKKPEESVFNIYPKLERGEWLRMDIHRRGNLTEKRFKSIISAAIKLVESGENVAFIELTASRKALEHYNLRDKLVKLSEKPNFLFTPVWKEYANVIEFLRSEHCHAILTDSGSMQEEMNELQKPCMTCRFNTDRPETVIDAKSNFLVPPLSTELIVDCVNHLKKSDELRKRMSSAKKIYGQNVADKMLAVIEDISEKQKTLFRWAHNDLNIWKDKERFDYL